MMAAVATPIRVDLMTPAYFPEVHRGTERITQELAAGLLAGGHRPRLLTSHPGGFERTVQDGLPVVRVPRVMEGRLQRRMIEEYTSHTRFSLLALRLGDAQIAQAMHGPDAVAALKWKRRTGKPVIYSFMGVPDHDGMFERRHRLDYVNAALAGCDVVTVLSRAAQDAFQRWFGHEARLIYPGVDLSQFTVGSERAPDPTIICTASADTPRKNVPHVVEAFARVRRERPTARLVLVRPRNPKVAAGLEAPGVDFMDPIEDRRVLADACGRAWVSVLASVGEAFGLVLPEALACGTPVVGSAVGGIQEIVDRPEIGRLFAVGDVDALAKALLEALELAEDPATRRACRRRAEDFSTDHATDSYVNLYKELL